MRQKRRSQPTPDTRVPGFTSIDPHINRHDDSHGERCELKGFDTYLECQGGCGTLVPFPSNAPGTRGYFCDPCWVAHGPESGHRLPTIEERREIVSHVTPKAVAFLRAALPPDSPILSDLPLPAGSNPWTGEVTPREPQP